MGISEIRAAVEADLERAAQSVATPGPVADFTKPIAVWPVDVVEKHTGKRFAGTFRSQMPRVKERNLIGLVIARMIGGSPYDSVPPVVRQRLEMLATFEVVLTERPAWFRDPESFFADDVLWEVYGRILEHFTTFFRSKPSQGGGGGANEEPDRPVAPGEGGAL